MTAPSRSAEGLGMTARSLSAGLSAAAATVPPSSLANVRGCAHLFRRRRGASPLDFSLRPPGQFAGGSYPIDAVTTRPLCVPPS
jgi:hypothetical protein